MEGKPLLPTTGIARMDFRARGRARGEQIAQDLETLRRTIDRWLLARRGADAELQHHTQLKAIGAVLEGVRQTLSSQQIAGTDTRSGKLYDDCRRLAQANVWFERLWDFISTKFDQRRGATSAARMLRAADEVVWSCYHQVMKELESDHPARVRNLVPLTYIEPEYSPAAVQFDQAVPAGLRLRSGNPTLDRCLGRLPLPTVRLPPWCVSAPWSLVLVGHEVGHHVSSELNVAQPLADRLGDAARRAGLDELSAACWRDWSEEIFADAFSVFAMGPVAAVAITELEWTADRNLVQRKQHYPAPAIRLALMTRLAQRLGLDTTGLVPLAELREIIGSTDGSQDDWTVIDPALDVICSPLPGELPALHKLCDFDASRFAPRGPIAVRAEGLRGIGSLDVDTNTADARHMVSAAMTAWLDVLEVSDPEDRCNALSKLAARTPDEIVKCAEPGVRAAAGADVSPDAGREIAQFLLDAPFCEDPGDSE